MHAEAAIAVCAYLVECHPAREEDLTSYVYLDDGWNLFQDGESLVQPHVRTVCLREEQPLKQAMSA